MPEIDKRVLRDVHDVGWHVVKVRADEEGPAHAFSIGLWERFRHPEVLVVAPNLDFAHDLLNAIGARVREGAGFEAGGEVPGLVARFACAFRSVAKGWYPAFLGYAGWYYGGALFPALQCVWPDPEGRFPWDEGFLEELRPHQPVLTEELRLAARGPTPGSGP